MAIWSICSSRLQHAREWSFETSAPELLVPVPDYNDGHGVVFRVRDGNDPFAANAAGEFSGFLEHRLPRLDDGFEPTKLQL